MFNFMNFVRHNTHRSKQGKVQHLYLSNKRRGIILFMRNKMQSTIGLFHQKKMLYTKKRNMRLFFLLQGEGIIAYNLCLLRCEESLFGTYYFKILWSFTERLFVNSKERKKIKIPCLYTKTKTSVSQHHSPFDLISTWFQLRISGVSHI